jgi:hypothetical protein
MTAIDKRVCLVFIPDFGERLRRLDFTTPIWVVQSKDNEPVVTELWKSKTGNITSFQLQAFDQLLDTVDQHHPGWRELEVHGIALEEAERPLADYGGGQFTRTADGFLFQR